MKRFYLLTSVLLLLFSIPLFAQPTESYDEILIRANKFYQQGNFNESINQVTSCSIKEATVSNKWKAQRLLAMCYLADNKPNLALLAGQEMLELNPTYKPSELNDPAELIKLLKSIRVLPKLSLGLALSIGTNTTFPQITKSYVIADYNKTYTSQSSYQFGVSAGYNFTPNIGMNLGLFATQKAYKIDYAFNDWEVNVEEKLTYLNIPVTCKYSITPWKKFNFYIQAGAYGGYLLFSENNFNATYLPTSEIYKLNYQNSTERRNRFDYGVVGGLGVSYKVGDGQVFLNANYSRSFANITKEDTRYKFNELTYSYYYTDDDILLHNLSLSLGYSFFLNYKVIRN